MTYKRRGVIHFIQIGRFGFSFWWRRKRTWHDSYVEYYGGSND